MSRLRDLQAWVLAHCLAIIAWCSERPLEKHTGQATVSAAISLCRVLYGKMRVRSYDWEASDQDHPELPFSSAGASAWARQVLNQVAEPHHQPAALFPASGGNIHEFTAVEGSQCAVLDVLAPPYDIAGGEASPDQCDKLSQHLH